MSDEWSDSYSKLIMRRNRIRLQRRSGAHRHRIVVKHFAQKLALPPDRIDNYTNGNGIGEFAAQLAHKHINVFRFGFVNATVKMV
jgi:hypothetical protein